MNCHETIIFNNIKFYVHPIYNRYAASKEGQIYGKKHKIILKQNVNTGNGGYLYFLLIMKKEEKIIQFLDLFTNVFTVKYQMINKLITLIIINIIIV